MEAGSHDEIYYDEDIPRMGAPIHIQKAGTLQILLQNSHCNTQIFKTITKGFIWS